MAAGDFDLLPEHTHYRDNGCEVSPRCVECPLPRCRYELPGGLSGLRRRGRNANVLAFHRRGSSIDTLARDFNLSRRTIFRIVASGRRHR